MTPDPKEIEKRTEAAMTAIRSKFGTVDDEYGVTLFVSHHLEELEKSYWEQHLHSSTPEPTKVLELLVRSPHWDAEEDGLDDIDFTLPGDVTNYVICVNFDEDGEVEAITMES